jgi:hypothetical protein
MTIILLKYILKVIIINIFKNITPREYYASSKIGSIIRGYLARLYCNELLRQIHAAIVIQRLIRGKLGRIKWMREYWLKLSVVKSRHALVVKLKQLSSNYYVVTISFEYELANSSTFKNYSNRTDYTTRIQNTRGLERNV